MAAEEGFEPSHTESESAVLPLHNSAKAVPNSYFIIQIRTDLSIPEINIFSPRTVGVTMMCDRM